MLETLLDDFMTRAALAGIGLALVAGPLGCFVVWRRMAYFGDATAHATLLGIALALVFDMPILFGSLLIALTMAVAVVFFSKRGILAADAMLGVFAHAALALGLVVLSQMEGVRIDLMGYLFGDILAVSRLDVLAIWLGAAATLTVLGLSWRHLLNATISEPLAIAEGGRPELARLLFMILLAVVVATATRVVGLLLVTALLVLPASAARPLARTAESMAVMAAVIGVIGVVLGLTASYEFDSPTGPSIVVALFMAFISFSATGFLIRQFIR